MKIYVVRHGETNVNLENKINSWNNDDLNQTGINQAIKVGEKLKNIDYDMIISSPLARTKHTAELLNCKNAPIIFDDRLLERNFGIFTKYPIDKIEPDDLWSLNPKNDYGDAETVKSLIDRVFEFLEYVKTTYKDKNIILVTHGGTSKAISCYFYGIPDNLNINKYKHNNCEVQEFEL